MKTKPPKALDSIVDLVLAYRSKPKSKPARRRIRQANRLAWGHQSRHCVYCGKVGPRVVVVVGYAHRRCIPKGK
jgi:hypothetical protein